VLRASEAVSVMTSVRVATSADVERLVNLLGLLFDQEAEFVADPQLQRAALSTLIDDPRLGRVLVADDGEVVGMATLLWTISTATGTAAALLEDMVVSPNTRGRGVGSLLVEAAFSEARRRGVSRITLLTDSDNLRAQHLYQQLGFEPSTMVPMRWHDGPA